MAKIGSPLENLELETLGRVYIKTRDRRYELDYNSKVIEKKNLDEATSDFIKNAEYNQDKQEIDDKIESLEADITNLQKTKLSINAGNGIEISGNNTKTVSVKLTEDSDLVVDSDGLKLSDTAKGEWYDIICDTRGMVTIQSAKAKLIDNENYALVTLIEDSSYGSHWAVPARDIWQRARAEEREKNTLIGLSEYLTEWNNLWSNEEGVEDALCKITVDPKVKERGVNDDTDILINRSSIFGKFGTKNTLKSKSRNIDNYVYYTSGTEKYTKFRRSHKRSQKIGFAIYKHTRKGKYGWERVSNIAYFKYRLGGLIETTGIE